MIKSSKAETTESNGIIFPYHAVLVTYLFRASNCGDLFFFVSSKITCPYVSAMVWIHIFMCIHVPHACMYVCIKRENTVAKTDSFVWIRWRNIVCVRWRIIGCVCVLPTHTILLYGFMLFVLSFPGGSEGKASTCKAGDLGSIPESGRSPGEGNSNPLQYSCLGNPMDRGAW